MDADYILDVRGKPDPYPFAYTLHALQTLDPGQVLLVTAESSQGLRRICNGCALHGHRVARETHWDGSQAIAYLESAGLDAGHEETLESGRIV